MTALVYAITRTADTGWTDPVTLTLLGAGILVLGHEGADVPPPGTPAGPVTGLEDVVIELAVTPDRGYCLAMRGIAREMGAGLGAPWRDPGAVTPPAWSGAPAWQVSVDAPERCDRFSMLAMEGLDPTAPSPWWLRRRLTQAGVRSISLAVDVTNYVMLETGRPIHGYDLDKLQGPIVVRRARDGERLTTLDGTDRRLSTEDLVVTDDSGLIGLGGVMGGQTTEMSATTTRVLVESAHWDATSMFRTGRRHKITSEAGKRNERGVDPTICEAAADRVVELHVHAKPEQYLEFEAGTSEQELVVDTPGTVEVEEHDSGAVVALLEVG